MPVLVLGQTAGANLILLLVMGVVFWFLLIRPQQRRVREQRQLLSSLGTGDRVVTIGGIHGTITMLDDETVQLEIAPGTSITVARQAVGRRLVDADTAVASEAADGSISEEAAGDGQQPGSA